MPCVLLETKKNYLVELLGIAGVVVTPGIRLQGTTRYQVSGTDPSHQRFANRKFLCFG